MRITLANEHYNLAKQPWTSLLEMHHHEEIMHYPGSYIDVATLACGT